MILQDPIIDEIRRVRHEVSESVGHDSKKLVDLYVKMQEKRHKSLITKKVAVKRFKIFSPAK